MAFSIRSLFNPENDRPEARQEPPVPPQNLLFKVVEGTATNSGPVNAAPATTSPLAIGDVLSVLPTNCLAEYVPDPFAPLPLAPDAIEKALRSGEAALPLHEVYKACPALFRNPVSEDDPRRIVLPPDKIVKLLASGTVFRPVESEASSIEAIHPPAVQLQEKNDSVFSVADTVPVNEPEQDTQESETGREAPMPTPFNVVSPFTLAGVAPAEIQAQAHAHAPEAAQPGTPEPSSPAPAEVSPLISDQTTNPFERISALGRNESQSAAGAPVFTSKPSATEHAALNSEEASTSSESGVKITLSLLYALRYCHEEEIGIDPTMLPESVDVTLPFSVIQRQIASGDKPAIKIRELRAGLLNEHKVLLAAARPDLSIRLPVGSFTGQEEGPPAQRKAAAAPSPAFSFSPPKQEDESPSFLMDDEKEDAVSVSNSQAGTSFSEDVDPFADMPLVPDWGVAEHAESGEIKDIPFEFPPLPGFGSAAPTPEHPDSTSASFPPAPSTAQAAFGSLNNAVEGDHASSTAPIRISSKHFPQVSISAKTTTGVVPSASALALSSLRPNKHRRMLLRLLLGTQDDLDAGGIVKKVLTLSNVLAVGCVYRDQLFASDAKESELATSFISHIVPVHQHLLPLVQMSGLESTETITLRSDDQLATFALNQGVMLAILHRPASDETELLEKITLLTAELAGMLASEYRTA